MTGFAAKVSRIKLVENSYNCLWINWSKIHYLWLPWQLISWYFTEYVSLLYNGFLLVNKNFLTDAVKANFCPFPAEEIWWKLISNFSSNQNFPPIIIHRIGLDFTGSCRQHRLSSNQIWWWFRELSVQQHEYNFNYCRIWISSPG